MVVSAAVDAPLHTLRLPWVLKLEPVLVQLDGVPPTTLNTAEDGWESRDWETPVELGMQHCFGSDRLREDSRVEFEALLPVDMARRWDCMP
jgi:hypothetical protein